MERLREKGERFKQIERGEGGKIKQESKRKRGRENKRGR